MPIYPVKNNTTGERKELNLSLSAYEQWRKDNPDWDKDWSQGVAGLGEVGDWRNKTDGGWNEVLQKVSQVPGSNVKPYK
ncbi:MAG: hypothetical protein CMB98_05155 [Flavobacteriaceae bacterium]|nr:hypothetical protein [Flavobacteriaceae bacterium]